MIFRSMAEGRRLIYGYDERRIKALERDDVEDARRQEIKINIVKNEMARLQEWADERDELVE